MGKTISRPFNPPPLVAVARYSVDGVEVEMTEVVRRREPNLPYGFVLREVRTVPRVAVTVSPMTAVVPLLSATRTVDLDVTVLHNASVPTNGQIALTLPVGWTSTPALHAFTFQRAGERSTDRFTITAEIPGLTCHFCLVCREQPHHYGPNEHFGSQLQ